MACTDVSSKNEYYTIQEVCINMLFLTKRQYTASHRIWNSMWLFIIAHHEDFIMPCFVIAENVPISFATNVVPRVGTSAIPRELVQCSDPARQICNKSLYNGAAAAVAIAPSLYDLSVL
jgi:hypothetical protein